MRTTLRPQDDAAEPIDLSRRAGLTRFVTLAAATMSRGLWASPIALLGSNAFAGGPGSHGDGQCILSPEGRTGPFYTALSLFRGDIRDGKTGVILDLSLKLRNGACAPLVGAAVAIWCCDSRGMYSEYPNINPDVAPYTPVPLGQLPLEAPHYPEQDTSQYFLRGVQLTDGNGSVSFRAIYPSWYATRTPHVHVKVYPGASVGDTAAYTGQLYFPEIVNVSVLSESQYTGRSVARDTWNATDRHYVAMGGLQNLMDIRKTQDGLVGRKTLVVPV
jgi:protocatechuate 3,4-dioxygenase beta subunit